MTVPASAPADAGVADAPLRRAWPTLELLAAGGMAALLFRPVLAGAFDGPAAQTWATIFVSLTVQALPFLVLGVVVSGAIAAFVPAGSLARLLPRRPALAVPTASAAGVLLPGCECSSVPVAGRLIAGGAPAPAALAFMLAAPALNPVVIVATAVAFPGQPGVVLARFVASFLTAVIVGLAWARFARSAWSGRPRRSGHAGAMGCEAGHDRPPATPPPPVSPPPVSKYPRLAIFSATARHDFGHAGGFLVLGAATAATLQVVAPRSLLDTVGGSGVVAVLTLAVLAVVLAVCSEADAFVAASLVQFSPTRPAGLHGGGAGGRREARRSPGRHVRPPVRRPLRPGHVRGRRRLRCAGGVVVPVSRSGMNEEAQAGLILALGFVALRLGLTGDHLAYIQPAMGPALVAAGVVLAALGGVVLLRPRRAGPAGSDGHDHAGGSRVGWLLVAPILAIAVVAPSPLGAFAADRAPEGLAGPVRDFGPLPSARAGAVDLPLDEFVGRIRSDQGRSLRDVPVRLTGFVTAEARGDGFLLTRFVIGCCAADARPVRVAIRGAEPPWPAPDTWLEVTGTWRTETRSAEDTRPPVLDVTTLRTIPPPGNEYLS